MAHVKAARQRLEQAAADHGWEGGPDGGEHRVWRRGERRISIGFNRNGAVKWAFVDDVFVDGRGKFEAVLEQIVSDAPGDDEGCSDCLRPLGEHCSLCEECDCEGQECQDEEG